MNNTTDLYNSTHLEDDIFDEQEQGEPFDVKVFIRYTFLAAKVLSDITIMYTIRKFQILNTWENSLVMHWALVDLIFVLFHVVILNGLIHPEINLIVPCLITTLISTLFLSTIIFAEAILVGFVVLNSKCSILNNHERSFKKYYVLGVYIFCLLEGLLEFFTCHHWFDIPMFTTHAILLASTVTNILLGRIIKYDGHVAQTYYVVYISNIAIFSLIPVFVYHYLFRYFRSYEGFTRFLESTMFISYVLLLSDSSIILYILYRYCREFKTVLVLLFKKLVLRSGISWSELQQEV